MKKLSILTFTGVCIVSLSGCVDMSKVVNTPTNPIVTEYNGDSVKIQVHGNEAYNRRPVEIDTALANTTCKKGGKKAEYASSKASVAYFRNEHFFLCVDS